jgi:hypothetical protein
MKRLLLKRLFLTLAGLAVVCGASGCMLPFLR